jgi:hypothetical protein
MLIRPHSSSRDLNAPAEKTTITRFNEQRAAKPDFYKIKAGDVFATWPTIKAFQGGTSNGGELPTYYEWNGSKLIKTTKGHFRTRSPYWMK